MLFREGGDLGNSKVNLGGWEGGRESEFRGRCLSKFTGMVGPASFVRAMGQGGGHGFRMNNLRLRQCGSSSKELTMIPTKEAE